MSLFLVIMYLVTVLRSTVAELILIYGIDTHYSSSTLSFYPSIVVEG